MAPPLGTDPDDVIDLLPYPYSFVVEVLDEVFGELSKEIHEIEKRRRSDEYEFGLPRVQPSGAHQIMGKVSCVGMDPRGSNRLAVGTYHGEVMLIDCKEHQSVLQKTPFAMGEKIQCLAMSSATSFRLNQSSWVADTSRRPSAKLAVAGAASPRVLVYDIRKEKHGPALRPLCSVELQVPAAEGGAEGAAPEAAPPPVAQLCCCGTLGALWLVVLRSSGACCVYLCPPGPAEVRGKASQDLLTETTILEDEEVVHEDSEFSKVDVIDVPLYQFQLPSMVPIAGQPEPPLSSILVSAFSAAPERRAPAPAPPPLTLLLASTGSNVVQAYSLLPPEAGAPPAADAEAVLRAQRAPEPAPAPAEPLAARARRRWLLPARTAVRAVSGDGAVFAAGGSDGSVALFWAAPAPALKAMLPGHYAAVSAASFAGSGTLVTVSRDSWVHLYAVAEQALALRCLLTPPPTTPPGIDVITAPTVPISLIVDEKGNLRFMDTRLHRKVAAAVCPGEEAAKKKAVPGAAKGTQPGATKDAQPGAAKDAQPGAAEDAQPVLRQVLASTSGFCVLRFQAPAPAKAVVKAESPADSRVEGEARAKAEAEASAKATTETKPETTELYFFDHSAILPQLFDGIAARVHAGAKAEDLFRTLTAEDMKNPPDHMPSTAKATLDDVGAPGNAGAASPSSPGTATGQRLRAGAAKAARAPSAASEGSRAASMPLTAANLERAQSISGAAGAAAGGGAAGRGEAAGPGRLVPESWQAAVKGYLHRELGDRAGRQARMQQRLEQMRRKLEQAAA